MLHEATRKSPNFGTFAIIPITSLNFLEFSVSAIRTNVCPDEKKYVRRAPAPGMFREDGRVSSREQKINRIRSLVVWDICLMEFRSGEKSGGLPPLNFLGFFFGMPGNTWDVLEKSRKP